MAKHFWKIDDYDGGIDEFGFETDYHNGPRCKICGQGFCHHCEPECYDYECPGIIDTTEVIEVKELNP